LPITLLATGFCCPGGENGSCGFTRLHGSFCSSAAALKLEELDSPPKKSKSSSNPLSNREELPPYGVCPPFDTEPSLPKLFTLSPSLLERVVGVGEEDGEWKSISDAAGTAD
jgi:hypothetical protein